METLTKLKTIYQRAANPAESFADLFAAVDSVFGPLSAAESLSLASEFGIRLPVRTKRNAIVAVRKRVETRLESAQRCEF